MTKQEIIEMMAKTTGCTKAACGRCVEGIIGAIKKSLAKGEEVAIAGLGTFRAVKRAARTARNPKTGETIQVPAKTVPKFKAAKDLKEAVK